MAIGYTHVQYTQTDTNRQNTLTNRAIGELITIRQSSLVDWCHWYKSIPMESIQAWKSC